MDEEWRPRGELRGKRAFLRRASTIVESVRGESPFPANGVSDGEGRLCFPLCERVDPNGYAGGTIESRAYTQKVPVG